MIEFYVNQINMGRMTIEQVPEIWREKVRKALRGEDVEPPVVNTDIPKKAKAFDYLTGRSVTNNE